MIRKIVIFPHTTIIPHKIFARPDFFNLDNPDPNPVERKTISNPNPKNSKYLAGLDSKIRILYTTDVRKALHCGSKKQQSSPDEITLVVTVSKHNQLFTRFTSIIKGHSPRSLHWDHSIMARSRNIFMVLFFPHISVEHDPVYGPRSNRILQFRTGSGLDWISKISLPDQIWISKQR